MRRAGANLDPIQAALRRQPVLIVDGGLASELEARGCRLDDELWSARLLVDQPELIRQVHLDYLRAGADCIISASYQATLEGFRRRGLEPDQAARRIAGSIALCRQARAQFWRREANRRGRLRPLVAASIGPYGASLADGSEFRGDYDLDESGLWAFHERRWRILAAGGADLLACETIPSHAEARVLRRLLDSTVGVLAWFSFSCRDGRHLADGSELARVAAELDDCPAVAAVGVNCTAPRHISSLIRRLRRATSKPIIVYPNSGERWNDRRRRWEPSQEDSPPLADAAEEWFGLGARLVGGCCRTGPGDIERLRRKLLP